jgi:hypothetical protein
MPKSPDQRTAREVRDQLEQAVYTLPRGSKSAEHIASQIAKAIEFVIELEFASARPARPRATSD